MGYRMNLTEIMEFMKQGKDIETRMDYAEALKYYTEILGEEYVLNLQYIDFLREDKLMEKLMSDFKDVFGCEFKDRLPLEKLKKLYPDLKK